MIRRCLLPVLLVLLAAAAPAATAAEPAPKGFEGAFELHGTNGYRLVGLVGSTGTEGTLALFVAKRGADATYLARGKVTKERIHFDLGDLGEIDAEVEATGRSETIRSACGKPITVEGEAFVGTISFHGEEGFTEAEASRTPLRFKPILDLPCGAIAGEMASGRGLPGVELKAVSKDGSRLRLDQNRPGARVDYEAKTNEEEDGVRVQRTVIGHLDAATLSYSPSLDAASFSGGAAFSGRANYVGRSPSRGTRPGHGTWRGTLKVDFPGRADVPLAGPTFSASVVHAEHHGFND